MVAPTTTTMVKRLKDTPSWKCGKSTTAADTCSMCLDTVKKGTMRYASYCGKGERCTNLHIICAPCMEEDNNQVAIGCKHKIYEETELYEMVQATTYSWMDKMKPTKQCCACGKKRKPTKKNAFYYCRKCKLHRVCNGCWQAGQQTTYVTRGSAVKGTGQSQRSTK